MSDQLSLKTAEQSEEVEPSDLGSNASAPKNKPGKRLSRRQLTFRRFLRNKTAVVGTVVYLLLWLIAIFGPFVSPWGAQEIDNSAYLKPPSAEHVFGTTQSGSDVLALVLVGMRKSMLIGISVALISVTIAATVGSFAAYFSGWFERIALWVIDLLLVVPSFLIIAIIMTSYTQPGSSWLILVVLLAGFAWMLDARVVRSLSLSVKEREYVQAAQFMGLAGPKIVFRHILPNISSLLIINGALSVGYAVLGETGLSFFGFGIQPPDTSLGTLIATGQTMASTFPWIFLAPSAVLVVMVLSVNAMGDGLRDALDPNSAAGGRA